MSEPIPVKRPVVASPSRPAPVAAVAGTLALAGLGVFFWLAEARAGAEDPTQLPPLAATVVAAAAPAAPAPIATTAVTPPPPAPYIPANGPVTLVATPPTRSFPVAPTVTVDRTGERLRAPTLVVDLAQAEPPRPVGSGDVRSSLPPAGSAANQSGTSDTERFASRIGSQEVQTVQAQRMSGLDRLVPQGAIIGAVMETALNSDQPGFARALVQRDVYSFDGSAVLIPAGSRIIGQYKSGVAQGASRLFVLWTRLIRPDGVSIELASPAVDDLGRGGVAGKVNRHFLERFGGAILMSVLTGGISAAAASVSSGQTVVVGSLGQASSLAGEATRGNDIPPTITTRQGAPVRIFVARDLDFSRVGPVR